jgi:hypothetical protein
LAASEELTKTKLVYWHWHQVEEDDLIQFSDGQPIKKSPKTGSKSDQLDELNEGEDDEDLVRLYHRDEESVNHRY